MWWTLQCVQYDGCSLQSYSSYPSALCGARTQTHSSTHIVLHTHSYKHLYTVSQYNTYQHKHTETQTRAKTHVHRQRHRERHMDTNWLSHKLNCLQFVQPAQLTYFAFHKFGLCYSQAEFVLLTSVSCATRSVIAAQGSHQSAQGFDSRAISSLFQNQTSQLPKDGSCQKFFYFEVIVPE